MKIFIAIVIVWYGIWPCSTAESSFLKMLQDGIQIIKNENCSKHLELYLEELSKLTPWALEMFDATAKFPSGILDGNLRQLGHFDECLSVTVTSGEENDDQEREISQKNDSLIFNGQYCLVTVNLDLRDPLSRNASAEETYLLHNINQALDKMMLQRRDLENRKKKRASMDNMPVIPIFTLTQWAVCMPSTCHRQDIEIYLQNVLNNTLDSALPTVSPLIDVHIEVDSESCVSYTTVNASHRNLAAIDHSFLWFLSFLVVAVILGTLLDLFSPTNTDQDKSCISSLAKCPGGKILLAFSLPANLKKIVGTASPAPQNSTSALNCLDGVRLMSTLWVTLTHKVLLLTREPFLNKGHLKESLASLFWVPLTANMMSVDSFLFLGGLLRSYNYARDLDQRKSNQLSAILQRYLRLTPALAAVIWFYASVLEHLYNGPEWKSYIASAAKDCRENWLSNVLYLNNYIGFPRLCILQSWYLSADMQLFILSPILIYPLWVISKNVSGIKKYLGGIPMIIALVACIASVFISTYRNGYPALYRVGSEDQSLLNYTQYIHMATHCRMGPYILGLMVGLVLHHYRGRTVRIPKLGVFAGWSMTAALFIYVLYGPYSALQLGAPLRPIPDSLYASTHRVAWGLALSWMVFSCCKGYGGPVNKILSAKIFKQLSNISYCMFLVHFAVLLTNLGAIRSTDYKDQYKLTRDFIADIVVTMVFSVVLYVLVEAPFSTISNFITGKGQKTERKQLGDEGEQEKHKNR